MVRICQKVKVISEGNKVISRKDLKIAISKLDIFISISSSGCFQDIKRRLVWQQMVLRGSRKRTIRISILETRHR